MALPKVALISSIRKSDEISCSVNKIVNVLKKNNIRVFHEHVTNIKQADLNSLSDKQNLDFHNKIIQHIRQADVIISECSNESFSVGYLLSKAVELNKEVIIFYKSSVSKPNLFPFLNNLERIYLVEYSNTEELEELVVDYLSFAQDNFSVRYNLMLPPQIINYLKWVSRKERITRSSFIRDLIKTHMDGNEQYFLDNQSLIQTNPLVAEPLN